MVPDPEHIQAAPSGTLGYGYRRAMLRMRPIKNVAVLTALEDHAPSRGRVPLACYFVPTLHRATPGTRTLPSFSNALTFAMAFARIRSRAGSSIC